MDIKCVKIENMTDCVCEPKMIVKYMLKDEIASYVKRRDNIVLESEIKEPSPTRTKIICPKFYGCGGCDFLHVKYENQLLTKREHIDRLFKIHKLPLTIHQVTASDQPLNYRHKAVLSATTVKGKLRLGLYKKQSKEIFPYLDCHLHDVNINQVFKTIEEVMNLYKIKAYQYDQNQGLLKHVLIRKSYHTQEMLITFVTHGDVLPHAKQMIQKIREAHPKVTSFVQNIHYKKTHLVLLEKEKVLYGSGFIVDEIKGIKFRLSSQSFYQINPMQMIKLYDQAFLLANIKKTDFVVDTYSGIGTISLLAALYSNHVVAIESNPSAHKDALENKKLNQMKHIHMIHDDVSKVIKEIDRTIDVLIMDPPREGASFAFLEQIKNILPRKIIYISCNPETLVRDLKQLKDNYQFEHIYPVDMFSQTIHVETITLLSLKTA